MTEAIPVVVLIKRPNGYEFDCPACGKTHYRKCVLAVTGCDTQPVNFHVVVQENRQ